MRQEKWVKVLAVLSLLVLLLCALAGCSENVEPDVTTTPVVEEKDLFYFNLDKAINPSVVRQKDRVTGIYTMRFLKDGQIVELQTNRDNIPSQLDNLKAIVLTFDDEGYIKKLQSAQSAIGGQFFDGITVTAVDGNTYTIDSRTGTLTVAEDVNIYDLTGLTAEIGSYGNVQVNDVICCYADASGIVTQVYIMERRPEHDDKHSCEHCDTAVEWISWDGTEQLVTGHYCLTGNVDLETAQVLSNADVALCLNGYTLTGEERLFELNKDVTLSIIDHAGFTGDYAGHMIGGGVSVKGKEAADLNGGVFYVSETASLNIYGGNIGVSFPANKACYANRGGVIYAEGAVTVAGGVITGGDVGYSGGAIYIGQNGSFALSGGTVQYGSAYKQENISGTGRGGTICITKDAKSAEITGGKLIAGIVDGYGGGLYTEISMSISNAVLCGDWIDGTTQAEYGGVMWVGGPESVVDLKEGTVFTGGSSIEGGNIAVRVTCTINIHEGVEIRDGYSSRNGGNAAVFGTLNINGGKVINGYSDGAGGNIYAFTNGNTIVNVNSGLVSGGSGTRGGNICMSGNMSYENGSILNVIGGEITNGEARTDNGGNISLRLHSVANITGGTITGGTAAKNGGGVCTAYTSDSDVSTTLNVGGSAVISGNNGSDIYLVAMTDMNILEDQPFTADAKIGLAAEDPTVALVNFVYDDCLNVFTWTPGDKILTLIKEQIFAT